MIRPICIPFEEPLRLKNFENYWPFIAGWGQTSENGETSDVLHDLQVEVLNNKLCENKYNSVNPGPKHNFDVFICAGYFEGGKDSCKGIAH